MDGWRIINRPLSTEAAKCRWRKVDRLALRGGTSGTGDVAGDNRWRVEVVPGAARSNGALPHRSLFDVFNFPASSSGSAPRTSSSRRPAPFGAAPRPSGSPILSGPPACPPGTSAATRPPAPRTPPTWSSAAWRRKYVYAALPARHSMARLSRSCTQPSRELSYSTPLPQPFCEPVRLFCGREPDELPKDPAEELPKELWMVES